MSSGCPSAFDNTASNGNTAIGFAALFCVRYEQINAMLLNEFLKEHRRGEEQDCKIQEQETTIAELRSEIRSLAAMVNEQASELRNVGAQLQISNAGAQAIAKNP